MSICRLDYTEIFRYYHKADGSARAPNKSELLVKMCDFRSYLTVYDHFGVLLIQLCACRDVRIDLKQMQFFFVAFFVDGGD